MVYKGARKYLHTKKEEPIQVPNHFLDHHQNDLLTGHLEETVQLISDLLAENYDFVVRRFDVFGDHPAAMIYFANLIDQASVNTDILKPLMYGPPNDQDKKHTKNLLLDTIQHKTLYHTESILEKRLVHIVEALFRGETLILIDEMKEAFLVETRNVEKRSLDNPQTEQVIRGPREGFIEPLGSNVSLLRYRLQTPNFRIKSMKIGKLTRSKVAYCYIEGLTNNSLLQEVQDRLSAIEIDSVLDAGYIEQYIEDHHMSPFPQVQYTERPDKTVAAMLEGKIAIMVDGSPFALIVPAVFSQFYQTTEDYTERFFMASLIRMVRLLSILFALVFPSLYVAIISFNPELIPTDFAVAVAGGRAGVPFPSIIEVLIMELAMEVLREATLRLPQQVGGALSIVGVLVIGQAAVEAGFVSPITVVVIAITTIGSFATPAYNAAIAFRMLRFPLIILAGIFGLYGVMVGLILIVNHLLSLKSFGVPYMSPIVPGDFEGMKDSLIRGPLWWMKERPRFLHPYNKTRVSQHSVDEIKQSPSNTLDPLKAGNDKWEDSDGVPTTDYSNSSDDNHR